MNSSDGAGSPPEFSGSLHEVELQILSRWGVDPGSSGARTEMSRQ